MPQAEFFLSKKIRTAIMIAFIAFFFICAPLLILYTAGYRFDFVSQKIKQTGVISIDAKPEDSRVFLNGFEIKKKIPIRLANRAPGPYRVRIEKDGYYPWEKEITVESKQTTYIKNVKLFKIAKAKKLFSTDAARAYASTSGEYLIIVTQNEGVYSVDMLETATNERKAVFRFAADEEPTISWSPFFNHAFVAFFKDNETEVRIFEAASPETASIYKFASRQMDYQWTKNAFAPSLCWKKDENLFLLTGKTETLIDNKITDLWFYEDGNGVWQYQDKTLYSPDKKTINVSEKPEKIIDIDKNRIITRISGRASIIRLENEKFIEEQNIEARNFTYNQATEEWLAWSEAELWSIYKDGRAKILHRSGDKHQIVRPADNHGVLIIALSDSLRGFNPGYYTAQTLLENDSKIEEMAVNKKKETIVFLGSVNGSRGIWEMVY